MRAAGMATSNNRLRPRLHSWIFLMNKLNMAVAKAKQMMVLATIKINAHTNLWGSVCSICWTGGVMTTKVVVWA